MIPGLGALRRARVALDHDVTLGTLLERLAPADPDRVLVDEAGGPRRRLGSVWAL